MVSLGEAIDAPELAWWTSGDSSWYGQTEVSFDGVDAVRLGNVGPNGGRSDLETTVTGPGQVIWRWLRGQSTGPVSMYVNDVRQAFTGGRGGWEVVSINLYEIGDQVIRFSYEGSDSSPEAWIDAFHFIPANFRPWTGTPTSARSVFAGDPATIEIPFVGSPPFTYQWSKDGTTIPGETNRTLHFPAADFSHAGLYSLRVDNAFGFMVREVTQLEVTPDLGEAVDAPQLAWTSGPTSWFTQPDIGVDGDDAAFGPLAPLGQTAVTRRRSRKPRTSHRPGGPLRFKVHAPRRSRLILETTTNLRSPTWTVLRTNSDPNVMLEFSVTNTTEPRRFFRVAPRD